MNSSEWKKKQRNKTNVKCQSSVWTEEGVCIVLNATVTADENCSYNCGSDCWRLSKYPCLQVYVSVNSTGRVSRLSHNEETQDTSSEVSTVPDGKYWELLDHFNCWQWQSDVGQIKTCPLLHICTALVWMELFLYLFDFVLVRPKQSRMSWPMKETSTICLTIL